MKGQNAKPTSRKALFNRQDQRRWDAIFLQAPATWKQAPASPEMVDCLRFLQAHRVRSVLDVGCGIGIWAVFLSRAGLRVKGFDFSAKAITYAQRWAAEEKLAIDYACAPVTAPPFAGEHFDAVVAAKVLDNVSREELAIATERLFDCLKDGGVAFCLFNPLLTAEEIERLAASDNPTAGITHIVYTDDELRGLFAGVTLLDFKRYPHGFRGLFLQKKTA